MSDKKKAKAPAKGEKPAKDKKNKKGKGGDVAGESNPISISNHPRARASVRKAKAGVGLAAFALTLLLSMKAGVPLAQAAERALVIGVAGYLVAWACAVMIWRAVIVAEMKAYAETVRTRRAETIAVANVAAAAAAAAARKAEV